MWNPTPPSSSTALQNINEVVDINDFKCCVAGENFGENPQQQIYSKQETSKFKGFNIENKDDNTKYSEVVDETIDSGFISGPQTTYSENLDTDNEAVNLASCEIKKLNITDTTSESQALDKKTQELNLDSGIIEEEYDDNGCDLKQQNPTSESDMRLPHGVDSGISEWFCNLSLQNNPNTNSSGLGINNLGASSQQAAQQTRTQQPVNINIQQYQEEAAALPPWEIHYKQDDDGDTSLHLACVQGYERAVTALIRMAPHQCLFNIQNDDVLTPLHLATLTAQPRIIRMLLIAGAKPTVRDRHGNTPLHLACIAGDEECVRALTIPITAYEVIEAHRQRIFGDYGDNSYLNFPVAQLPSDLEIRNYDGENCVHIAAQAGFINILRILVTYGADINAREGKAGRTALHFAIEKSNEELANYLLDECEKLNVETLNYARLTAYQVARSLNKSELQNILQQRGAEPLSPPESDYDSSDSESDLEDAKLYDRFGDPGYFAGYKSGNAMTVA